MVSLIPPQEAQANNASHVTFDTSMLRHNDVRIHQGEKFSDHPEISRAVWEYTERQGTEVWALLRPQKAMFRCRLNIPYKSS